MATKKEIHEFALFWYEKYRNPDTTEREVVHGFADACFALGFVMDCGKSFEARFPEIKVFEDAAVLGEVINQVQDIPLLGSAIFSNWRYVSYWTQARLLEPSVRDWFIIAFSRLIMLSADDGLGSLAFQGPAKKIKIVSNSTSFDHYLRPDEEVRQHLTICADGRVWFSAYNVLQSRAMRQKTANIGKAAAGGILEAVECYFSNEHCPLRATDVGDWQLVITNTDGKAYCFDGSLICNPFDDINNLSKLIRDTLEMPDLLVFDGNCETDRVEKITIDYHRVTKINVPFANSDTPETAVWDYNEQLVIDRTTETLELTQQIGSGCTVTHKYYVKEGVSNLLDEFDDDDLFDEITGNGPDVAAELNETKHYKITVTFSKRPQLVLCGTYDKNGLPEDWPELAEQIFDFIDYYGFGEILAPTVYLKVRRKTGDYIVCSVEFEEGGKNYAYLTEDDTLSIGDLVVVPVGEDGHSVIVKIAKMEYLPKDKLPFPLQKMKRIISRYLNIK